LIDEHLTAKAQDMFVSFDINTSFYVG